MFEDRITAIENQLAGLQARNARLERTNRTLRILAFLGLAAVLSFSIAWKTSNDISAGTVRAREFRLVDKNGTDRARLYSSVGGSALLLQDDKGRPGIRLYLDGQNHDPYIEALNSNTQKPVFRVSVDKHSNCQMQLANGAGSTLAEFITKLDSSMLRLKCPYPYIPGGGNSMGGLAEIAADKKGAYMDLSAPLAGSSITVTTYDSAVEVFDKSGGEYYTSKGTYP